MNRFTTGCKVSRNLFDRKEDSSTWSWGCRTQAHTEIAFNTQIRRSVCDPDR